MALPVRACSLNRALAKDALALSTHEDMANRAGASKEEGTRDEVQLSKALSKLLRHDAIRMNVAISQEGWVLVSDALKYANQKKRPQQPPWSEEDVARVVNGNDKQRFALRERGDGRSEVRANQGHSMPGISVDMVELSSATAPPMALHGTYHRAWPLIRSGGLSKMSRQHVHMARALPGESGVLAWSNAALSRGRVLLLRLVLMWPLSRGS